VVVSAIRPPLLKIFREYRSMSPSSYGSGTTSAASLLCSADRLGTTASGVLVEQCGEFLRREDPVALDYELTDLLPVHVVGEQHPDAITAGSRGEERVASG
jgi:hypothetical protein